MAKFLTTLQTSAKIEKIITEAKEELTLITPYLKLTQIFYDRLIEADIRDVNIKLIYGKVELNPEDLEKIIKLKNLGLYFCENLHAKCYFNENLMVITSMNLHEFSQSHNREMGVQIKLEEEGDTDLFKKAEQEANSIIQASEKETNESKSSYLEEYQKDYQDKGYCLRCKTEINFSPQRPLCRSCFDVWIKFADPYYQETYCHKCSKESQTSYAILYA